MMAANHDQLVDQADPRRPHAVRPDYPMLTRRPTTAAY